MNNQLLSVVERENLNLNNFTILNTNILFSTIIDDLRTNLKDILFYLFQHKIKNEDLKKLFNNVYEQTQTLLGDQINKLGHLNKEELIVWHSSIFMSLMSFKNTVESKYTIKDEQKIIVLLNEIFENSLYDFINYNSKKFNLKSSIKDKLCHESISNGFRYVYKKSNKKVTLDSEHELSGTKISERMIEVEYDFKDIKMEV